MELSRTLAGSGRSADDRSRVSMPFYKCKQYTIMLLGTARAIKELREIPLWLSLSTRAAAVPLRQTQMLVCRYLILCEYASRDQQGRITLHNLFNRINAVDFPASHQPFAVAIELTALRRAVVNEQLTVRVMVLDGVNHEEVILETDPYCVSIEVGQTIATTLNVGRPVFNEPGDYRVRLIANGRPIGFHDLAICRIDRPTEL